MIEKYVPVDQRHDNFSEKFMQQRSQKLNKSEQPGMENTVPFPIEPIRAAPSTLPRKRVSNTSSDSGVNAPSVLSSAMLVTPDILQPYLIPSTSRMNPPSGPLTPFNNSSILTANVRTRSLKTIVPSLIILTNSLCFELALDKAIYKLYTSFFCTPSSPFAHMVLHFYGTQRIFCDGFNFYFIPDHHDKVPQIYPNCVWHVPLEWQGLKYCSALLTKVYWNYCRNIVRVCVTPFHPKTANLNVKRKSNKQVLFGSKALASLCEFLCHHSLTGSDPLIEEYFPYLTTRIPSHFLITESMKLLIMNLSDRLTLQFLLFTPTFQLNFSKISQFSTFSISFL